MVKEESSPSKHKPKNFGFWKDDGNLIISIILEDNFEPQDLYIPIGEVKQQTSKHLEHAKKFDDIKPRISTRKLKRAQTIKVTETSFKDETRIGDLTTS